MYYYRLNSWSLSTYIRTSKQTSKYSQPHRIVTTVRVVNKKGDKPTPHKLPWTKWNNYAKIIGSIRCMKKRLFYCLKQIIEQLNYITFSLFNADRQNKHTVHYLWRYKKHRNFLPQYAAKSLIKNSNRKRLLRYIIPIHCFSMVQNKRGITSCPTFHLNSAALYIDDRKLEWTKTTPFGIANYSQDCFQRLWKLHGNRQTDRYEHTCARIHTHT